MLDLIFIGIHVIERNPNFLTDLEDGTSGSSCAFEVITNSLVSNTLLTIDLLILNPASLIVSLSKLRAIATRPS